jgi:predicted Fe-S protein YdhL (DUF1289 family)
MARRRTTCRRAGHRYTPDNSYWSPDGKRFCRTCRRIVAQARRARRRPPLLALVRAGDSPQSASVRVSWAVRRDRYGPTGLSPDGTARLSAAMKARPCPDPLQWCRHGHRYTDANTYHHPNGRRSCKACRTLRRHRARWDRLQLAKQQATQQALRQAMVRAHPDTGGTHHQFLLARRRYERAVAKLA